MMRAATEIMKTSVAKQFFGETNPFYLEMLGLYISGIGVGDGDLPH